MQVNVLIAHSNKPESKKDFAVISVQNILVVMDQDANNLEKKLNYNLSMILRT